MNVEGATMQDKEKPKSGFWERADIVGAQRVLDVWGTVKWHWRLGGEGFPPLDWVDLKHEQDVYVRYIRRGRYFLRGKRHLGKQLIAWEEQERVAKQKFISSGQLSPPFLLTLGVDAVLAEFGNPPGLHGLLLHRYPATGPAARDENERSYRLFRPAVIQRLCGHRSRWMEVRIDQTLAQMERDFLECMSRKGLRR